VTKKQFIALADLIRHHHTKAGFPCFGGLEVELLAQFCATQNPQFKRDRWLGYIAGTNGQNGGKVKP
jgi:hypothetical protein